MAKFNYVWNYMSSTVSAFKKRMLGYRSYEALLTQTGTNPPSAIVLENTLGGDIVWSYEQPGFYLGTLTGAFKIDKTFCQGFTSTAEDGTAFIVATARYFSDNAVAVTTTNPIVETAFNDLLNYTPIQIRIYN